MAWNKEFKFSIQKKHENHSQKVRISIGYAGAINKKWLIVIGDLELLAG